MVSVDNIFICRNDGNRCIHPINSHIDEDLKVP